MWRRDLERNTDERSLAGAFKAFVTSPGFSVLVRVRFGARWRFSRNPLLRTLSFFASRSVVRSFGCYISPLANVGEGLCLPHPVAIVIGDGVVIGNDVTIYQGVTIGRKDEGVSEYPVIGDRAIVYSGAILLGKIRIGPGAIIAAHSVVLDDVPAGVKVAGTPARIVTGKGF
jgi:serine O-acetyltransferase